MAKGFTGHGQLDPFADAIKEDGAKLLFELLNLLGEGWLRNVQGRSGTPEMVGVSDGQEVAEMA
jgi:hypothetical protein